MYCIFVTHITLSMRRILSFLTLFIYFPLFAQHNQVARPKLVVGIVVDQMRWDYLYRYYDLYSNDGFKRLLNEGFACQNTMLNYLPSFTGPGHSCIYTGSVPSIHGIAANDWIDNISGRSWYCAEDTSVLPVDGSRKAGMMSPRNLLASTVTDELRLATNFQSRVYGVAIKDRGSILPAGHLANAAYWFDDSTGNFITSTYYAQQLPGWARDFNNKRYADRYMKEDWDLLYNKSAYTQSLGDKNPYEGAMKGEKEPIFPHLAKDRPGKNYSAVRMLPAGNTLTLKMAKACIAGEELGRGDYTDFLCVSLSSTDYIGHQFAPNSMEAEDVYLRLDRSIASFLNYLDEHVGNGNYLLFLTADHGAAHNAQYMQDINMPAGNESEQNLQKEMNAYLKKQFHKDGLINAYTNYQVYLNEQGIKAAHADRDKIKAAIIKWLKLQPQVAYAVDMEQMNVNSVPEPIKTMIVNGYNSKRSGCIEAVLNPGWYDGYAPTGTTHGTWNPYDTHIPLLFYGWHVPRGQSHHTVYMTDIAATVAAMLHIQMPNGCIGHIITDMYK